MCGILCIIDYAKSNIHEIFSQMLQTLDARGPDNKNFHMIDTNNIQLHMGFTRLAIMDTSNMGLQPFIDNHQCEAICNGEIYNYRELRSKYNIQTVSECDCEVILPVYHRVDFLSLISDELDAEYALIIYDPNKNKIFAARDRYGVRPLYYGYNDETQQIGIASELKALCGTMNYVTQLNPCEYLTIDLNHQNDSMINNISFDVYYNCMNIPIHPLAISDNLTNIHSTINLLLTNAVKKRLESDRKIGFLLSGGLDSSLIVAIACKLIGNKNVVCFSVGMHDSDDVLASQQVVKYLGIEQHHIIPFDNDIGIKYLSDVIRTIETYDVTTIRASTPQYIMAKYISDNTDIKYYYQEKDLTKYMEVIVISEMLPTTNVFMTSE